MKRCILVCVCMAMSGAVVSGCVVNKSEVAHSDAIRETPGVLEDGAGAADASEAADDSGGPLVCPNYYRIEDMAALSEDERELLDSPDGIVCSDGEAYCYAYGQMPVKLPENGSGYECMPVSGFASGVSFVEMEHYDSTAYPYCDGDNSKRRLYPRGAGVMRSGGSRRAWVCVDEELCECGEKPCKKGAICENEVCHAASQDDQALCERTESGDYRSYQSELSDEDAQDGDKRKCGSAWLDASDNRVCLHLPVGDVPKYQICSTDKKASKKKVKKADSEDEEEGMGLSWLPAMNLRAKIVYLDAERQGCTCGKEKCSGDTACWEGRCVDIADMQPLPSKDYQWAFGRPRCNKGKCACGSESCRKGEWCISGRCFDSPDVLKVEDRYIRYGQYEYKNYLNKYYYDYDKDEPLPRDHYKYLTEIEWVDILTHSASARCEDDDMPENLDDYICVIDNVDNGCGEGMVDTYAFRGWHCMKDEGCACGAGRCGKHGRCYHGQCLYDDIYLAMACAHDYLLWGHGDEVKADAEGNCRCGQSVMPPNVAGYVCESDSGMICGLRKGCACGDAVCAKGDYCLEPGKCVADLAEAQ